ncbi:MAG: Gfo/Idh/MocA family oxidoreductase [Micrococcales bacterium]
MSAAAPKRLGVIGSGSIVPFHLDALREAGFEIAVIGTRPGSERSAALAAKYDAAFADSWQDVLANAEIAGHANRVDALLIAPETSVTTEILAAALDQTSLPILVEKPISYSSAELDSLLARPESQLKRVLVGYNRRHYSSTAAAAGFLAAQGAANATFHASIPEASWDASMADERKRGILLANSVHVLDLLQHLFGELSIAGVAGVQNETGLVSRAVSFESASGAVGTTIITFGSPSGYFIDIHTPGKSASLKPIEFFNEFVGVQVIDPTPEVPLRHYVPTRGAAFELSQDDLDFKPGFLSQSRELYTLATDGPDALPMALRKSASIADARRILLLAEQLLAAF